MMHRSPLVPGLLLVLLTFVVVVVPSGCGVLNPSLTGTVTSNGVGTLSPQEGTILIAVFNTTTSIAAVRLEITKNNGGIVDLVVPVQPKNTTSASSADEGVVVQDCDVSSIRLVEVLASVSGTVAQFGTGLPALESPARLSCGKLVAITILGTAPNLSVSMDVF